MNNLHLFGIGQKQKRFLSLTRNGQNHQNNKETQLPMKRETKRNKAECSRADITRVI